MNSKISIMVSIVLAMLVASLDTTIIYTTMPIIAEELGNFNLFAWTFASYMIASTVLAPIAGRLSDIYGRKRIFGSGIVVFLVGSLLCGTSDSMIELVIFRAIQGMGAGFMLPFPAIIAGDIFSIEKRGKIQAFFSAMWGLSAILAPLLGSLFVEFLSWRWIFYVNVPVCLFSFILLLPYKEEYKPKRAVVDYLGALLFTAGVSLLLLTTIVTDHLGFYVSFGVLFIIFFIIYEKRHHSPIIPIDLLYNKPIFWMITNSFLACAALFGTASFIPLFLQHEGYSIFMSGVALLGMSFGWMLVSVPAGKWIIKYGYRPLLIIGNIFLVGSGLMLSFLTAGTSYWYVALTMLIQGLAFGFIVTVSIIGAQQLVHPNQKGISTTLQMFSRNIGTAIGITIMGYFLSHAPSFIAGIERVFTYSLILSLFALGASFLIKDYQVEK